VRTGVGGQPVEEIVVVRGRLGRLGKWLSGKELCHEFGYHSRRWQEVTGEEAQRDHVGTVLDADLPALCGVPDDGDIAAG